MRGVQIKVIVLLLAAGSYAQAQHHHHEQQPSKPTELLEGLGNHIHPIATQSALAQRFFDQGLALIFGFNHDEAARLFARASEFDPNSPMPHWGIALALGPNYNLPPMPEREEKAWRAIAKATELARTAPENERAYVEALVKRYSKDVHEDRQKLAVAYKDAMKNRLRSGYPDDLDAATLYAEALMNLRPWQLWTADGKPAEGTIEIVEVLEDVLAPNPNHPGPTTITFTPSKPPRRRSGPAQCDAAGSIMPGAGHIVHMPSHIFLRVGRLSVVGDE